MRRIILALALAFAAPALANAQDADPAARQLIETSGAQGVFEPADSENGFAVRHIGSGLVCHFYAPEAGRLVLYANAPRGDDVSCETRADGETTSLYATRYPEGTNLREQLGGAVAAIRHRFPDARQHQPELSVDAEGLPQRAEAAFTITIDGQRYFTGVSVALAGEWVIKVRYTATAPDDETLRQRELMAGVLMIGALLEVAPPAAQEPAGASPL